MTIKVLFENQKSHCSCWYILHKPNHEIPTSITFLFGACIAACNDNDLIELESLLTSFDSCKDSLSCAENQTYCSCCSGVDDECCDTFDAALSLYDLCEPRLDGSDGSKRQAINIVISDIKAFNDFFRLQDCTTSGGGSAALVCSGGLVGSLALLFAVIQHFI